MRFIKFRTYSEAMALNDRVTAECLRTSFWNDGTNNYCVPDQDENGLWRVPVLEGYELFFTTGELSRGDDPDWYQVTLWQFKQACAESASPLPGFDNLEQLIDFMISQMTDGIPKQRALRAWTTANNIVRTSATIEGLRQTVNQIAGGEIMTAADVDNLFMNAQMIEA